MALRYILYARKSSDQEDRQVQSLDDQISKLSELAIDRRLSVVNMYVESKSAKQPNNRPLFAQMIKDIEQGKADGILCWHVNRLSRNPVDSGILSWYLQQDKIKVIQTVDRQFLPQDNVLIFNIESGVANQYILDLRKATLRGLASKLEKGWLPGIAPIGYLNDKEEKTLIIDPVRFPLLRSMWDLMLTGRYTPPAILEIANSEWGFLTRKTKRLGGRPLCRSAIYKIFTSTFYAGIIQSKGRDFLGKHTPMVTIDEFARVQRLLGRTSHSRVQHHFAFTGMIRCAECNCFYTAEVKKKLIRKTDEIREYIYYHCTRRTLRIACTQRMNIRSEVIERQMNEILQNYSISQEFLTWSLQQLNAKHHALRAEVKNKTESQRILLAKAKQELTELITLRYRQMIDDEQFLQAKESLRTTITRIETELRQTPSTDDIFEIEKQQLYFAAELGSNFFTSGLEPKRQTVMIFAKNLTIKGGIVSIEPHDWLINLHKQSLLFEQEFAGLEPTNIVIFKSKNRGFTSVRT